MGAAHRNARPKGFLNLTTRQTSDPQDWKPTPKTLEIISQVKSIIAKSSRQMTARFIFYRMVVGFEYPKTEQAYNNLCEVLVKARRAQLIPFSAIVDNGTSMEGGVSGYDSRMDFLNLYKRHLPRMFSLSEMYGQKFHIELWSEDDGSVSMLADMVKDYPVTVYGTGGFSSVTVTHEIAQRVMRRELPTMFLHVGDYDPSGESIFKSMSQDVGAFVSDSLGCTWDPDTGQTYNSDDEGGALDVPDFRPVRVALTKAQADRWDLPTAPPKRSDTRSRNWVGETVQVQAMEEEQLEEVVAQAVLEYIDLDALEKIEEKSEELRQEMRPYLIEAFDNVIEQLGEDDE